MKSQFYYTQKNIKKSYKNNKFKISAPTWNKEFEIPDGSYSVSDIQCYFENILEKHGKKIKQKIESRLKLKKDIMLNFYLLKQ